MGPSPSYGYAPPSSGDTVFRNYVAGKRDSYGRVFDIGELLKEVTRYVHNLAFQMLQPATCDFTADPLRVKLTNTLTCLNDDEWKYLPLWAGGNDDGTGGVFQEDCGFAVVDATSLN